MAVFPSQKNALLILRGFRDEFLTRTNVTNFDRHSKVRALSDTMQEEMLSLREETIAAFQSNQLGTANGEDLDRFGSDLGMPRRQPTFAQAAAVELSVMFSVEGGGNFGSINGAANINLPVGTQVMSAPNNNELGIQVIYTVSVAKTLDAADTVDYVSVVASTYGSGHNVGAGVLTQHGFTSYVDSANDSLNVTNLYPILNGRDVESDRTYRFRLSRYYERLQQVNTARIQLEGLEIPGVTNVRTISGYYGIGTAAALVLGAEFQANSRLVQGVQERLEQFKTPGLGVIATAGTQVSFDLELEVTSSRVLTTSEQQSTTGQITRACNDFFTSSSSGGAVYLRDLAYKIQQETNGLVSLGAVGTASSLFKRVYIRKGLAGAATSARERLLVDVVTLEADEFSALGTLSVTYL